MPADCIFCGKRPVDKNKEHVIPLWLIEMTGDPKRQLKIPYFASIRKTLPNSFAFNSLTFPACTRCNSGFSDLEDQAKEIISKMLRYEEVDSHSINTFLNWLDKIRIGLWLGTLSLIGNPAGIKPKFHIASRVAAKDRMLVMHRCEEGPIGLGVFGTTLPMFWHSPVCFSLMINHFTFINASTDFLISRRLGFPYPTKMLLNADGSAVAEMAPGTERYLFPLIRMPYHPGGTEIFQPIFSHSLSPAGSDSFGSVYDTEYVRRHSMSHSGGIGKIILQRERSILFYEGSTQWLPKKKYKFEDVLRFVPIETLHIQNCLANEESMTNSNDRLLFSHLKKRNRELIEYTRKAEISPWQSK
ncbi:MAG: hypothetical protein NDI90_09900 [Nitrospira sp. BO4]|jgi:hypothetical protein|nr:hypothetical protein [Nitrospira sp. BO4]